MQNILVALDGSEVAEDAFVQARTLAATFHATVHLVQVVPQSSELEGLLSSGVGPGARLELDPGLAVMIKDNQRRKATGYLQALGDQLGKDGIAFKIAVLEGAAENEIVRYSDSNGIDCIVLTTQGRRTSALGRFFLGSVVDRVIRASKVPVMLVPPSAQR